MGKLKSAKEILQDIGFKKDSVASTQEAFVKFLMKEAASASVVSLPPYPPSLPAEQLEFDFEDHDSNSWPQDPRIKRVSHR